MATTTRPLPTAVRLGELRPADVSVAIRMFVEAPRGEAADDEPWLPS